MPDAKLYLNQGDEWIEIPLVLAEVDLVSQIRSPWATLAPGRATAKITLEILAEHVTYFIAPDGSFRPNLQQPAPEQPADDLTRAIEAGIARINGEGGITYKPSDN